jgi:hypothetical protein
MQVDGLLGKWNKEDWYSRLAPLENMGFRWSAETGRMEQMGPKVMQANTPWVHVKHLQTKHCGLDHNILFNMFGIIPPRCQECWKVTVTPNSFDELLKLEEVERELGHPSKCGMELRDYTPKFYGGYFYNNSFDEGRDCYKMVRDAVHEKISPDVSVILKRGCTEFEMIKGPSNYWHTTRDEEIFCEELDALVDVGRGGVNDQSPLITTAVRLRWALWAHMNGDMSYRKHNNDLPLFPDYVKYHEGPRADIKHDLAISRSVAKGNIPPEMSEEFHLLAKDFAKKKGVDLGPLAHSLGMNETNPLGMFNLTKATPDELKGEDATYDSE